MKTLWLFLLVLPCFNGQAQSSQKVVVATADGLTVTVSGIKKGTDGGVGVTHATANDSTVNALREDLKSVRLTVEENGDLAQESIERLTALCKSMEKEKNQIKADVIILENEIDSFRKSLIYGQWVRLEKPTGVLNGSNKLFTLSAIPLTATETVIVAGRVLLPGLDYSVSANKITLTKAPLTSEWIAVSYVR